MNVLKSDRFPSSDRAESLAVSVAGLVFTSGLGIQDGDDALDELVVDIRHVLAAMGSSPGKVAKCKITVDQWSALEEWDTVHGALFGPNLPARACVGGKTRDRMRLSVEIIASCGAEPVPIGPSTAALQPAFGSRIGDLFFTNGFFCEGCECGADLAGQSATVLAKIKEAIAADGSTFSEVLKVNGTPVNWHSFSDYNGAYKQFFHEPYAGRASIQGELPNPDALIGVEIVSSRHPERITVESEVAGPWHDRTELRADTVYLDDLHPLKGPHSHGVRAGQIIFAAGACPFDAADRLDAPGSLAAQIHRTIDNLDKILGAMGSSLDDVVKTNVTLSDIRLLNAFDDIYREYFPAPYPARQIVATGLAQPRMLVEIEAVAVLGARRDGIALVGAGR